jgi:general stress protein YciG
MSLPEEADLRRGKCGRETAKAEDRNTATETEQKPGHHNTVFSGSLPGTVIMEL